MKNNTELRSALRTRIDDISPPGEELSDEQLRLASGGAASRTRMCTYRYDYPCGDRATDWVAATPSTVNSASRKR